jgi:IS30 family transposase
MGQRYSQLGAEERGQIEVLLDLGWSLRAIGRCLQRSASTISREVARNGQRRARRVGIYCAQQAGVRAASRRRLDHRFKLARQPDLLKVVIDRLAMGWSPQQISGRLALTPQAPQISPESIYRYIYERFTNRVTLHKYLPRKRFRRGQGKRGGAKPIPYRVSVHDRPHAANARLQSGHWEADLMLFSRPGQALLVLCERTSRLTLLKAMPDRTAQRTCQAIKALIRRLPTGLRRSMTFDNGPEFYAHYQLTERLGLQGYFCDLRAPWQKGGVENMIGRLRRDLPRKTNLASLSDYKIAKLQDKLNDTPRQCLDFQTPKEVFSQLLQNVALQT